MDKVFEIFIKTLKKYLESRGRQIYSLSSTAGQDKVRIELRGLCRYFEGEGGYDRFETVYNELRERCGDVLEFEKHLIELHRDYIVVPISLLKTY